MTSRNKYGAIRTQVDGIWFASKKEAAYYQTLKLREKDGEISDIEIQPTYQIDIGGHKVCKVKLDFAFNEKISTGLIKRRVIDVKGRDNAMSKLKRKLVKAQYAVDVELV